MEGQGAVEHDADSSTGLLNRSGLCAPLQHEIQRAKRYQRQLFLLHLDCDNFKAVNDGLAHGAGDAVIVPVGAALRSDIRSAISAARVGADEFVAMLSRPTPTPPAPARAT